jgi:hypothetical protein
LKREADGRTTRDHLQPLADKGHKLAQSKLAGPPLPHGYGPLWECFLELDAWRGGGGMGMSPLTLQDVAAWESRSGVTLTTQDMHLLKRLDGVRLKLASERVK